jgi:hypothetical protein
MRPLDQEMIASEQIVAVPEMVSMWIWSPGQNY